MQTFRTFVGAFLALVSILVLMVLVVTIAVRLTVLTPNFYKESLRRANFYDTAYAQLTDTVKENVSKDTDGQISATSLEKVLDTPSVKADFQSLVENMIDQIFTSARSIDAPAPSVSLVGLKADLQAAADAQLGEQLPAGAFAQFPDTLDVKEIGGSQDQFHEVVSQVQHNYFRAQIVLWTSLIIAIGLLLLTPLIAAGFSRFYFSWLATILLIPGLLWVGLVAVARAYAPQLIAQADLPEVLAQTGLVTLIVRSFLSVVFYESLVLIIIAAVLIIVNRTMAYATQRNKKNSPAAGTSGRRKKAVV